MACWVWAIAAMSILGGPLERVGTLADPAIREASGIVASRRHPGIFWVHNDSGNAPQLFAVRLSGELVRSYRVAIPNIDWEDITTDDSGHLYLGDIGDNKQILPVRVIHKINEPDPTIDTGTRSPLLVVSSHYFRYPDRQPRDAEGLVVHGDHAFVVTKRADRQPAQVYRIPLHQPAPLLRPLNLEYVGILPGCVERVTGAALTHDGQRLAVVTDTSVRIFEQVSDKGWQPVGFGPFVASNVEAITWDGNSLILASEDRSIYRLSKDQWQVKRRAK